MTKKSSQQKGRGKQARALGDEDCYVILLAWRNMETTAKIN